MTNSDRRRWLEISAVVMTGALKYVLMDWLDLRIFYITAACLFWILFILLRYLKDRNTLKFYGFRRKNFGSTSLFLFPFALVSGSLIIWYGIYSNTEVQYLHLIPVLILYPFWGLIQQFMITALIAGNLSLIATIKLRKYQVMLVTSLLFALAHLPDFTLMIFAFLMEILFTFTYLKWRNLWSLGLFHGWISSLFLYFVLGRDLWYELWKIF